MMMTKDVSGSETVGVKGLKIKNPESKVYFPGLTDFILSKAYSFENLEM
jgi:hypothetical protein